MWFVDEVRFNGAGCRGGRDVSRGFWGLGLLHGGAVEGWVQFRHDILRIVLCSYQRSLPQELC